VADSSAEKGDDNRPWEESGAVRRDCVPHRGDTLQTLGNISAVCSFMFLFCILVMGPSLIASLTLKGILSLACFPFMPILILIALPFGLITWILSKGDLTMMRNGLMDPAGEVQTEKGLVRGSIGSLLALSGMIAWGVVFLMTSLHWF
jgi:hypothetical protein